MGTRYVWRKTTYSNLSLGGATSSNAGVAVESNVKYYLCSSYQLSVNSTGVPTIIPAGSQVQITSSSVNTTYPGSTYRYLIVASERIPPNMYANLRTLNSTSASWQITSSGTSKLISPSSGSTYNVQSLTYSTNTTYATSNKSNAYSSGGFFDGAYMEYLGEDNIDPTALTYPTKVQKGQQITLTVTAPTPELTPSTNFEYVYSFAYGGEAAKKVTSSNAKTVNVTFPSDSKVDEYISVGFRYGVGVDDGYGYQSFNYASWGNTSIGAITYNVLFGAWIFLETLKVWLGVSDKARKGKAMWIGVNGTARKVKAGWFGVNGIARRFM